MSTYKIIEFKYFDAKDIASDYFKHPDAWSRPYEYEFARDFIEKNVATDAKIHNSCWGFKGVHVVFKDWLDEKYSKCIHTDIIPSELPKTETFDITTYKPNLKEYFDCVINISTLEEIRTVPHVNVLNNLLSQVNTNGYLVITFDIHATKGLDLKAVEDFLGQKIETVETPLSGTTSKYYNKRYSILNCGKLIIQKI